MSKLGVHACPAIGEREGGGRDREEEGEGEGEKERGGDREKEKASIVVNHSLFRIPLGKGKHGKASTRKETRDAMHHAMKVERQKHRRA